MPVCRLVFATEYLVINGSSDWVGIFEESANLWASLVDRQCVCQNDIHNHQERHRERHRACASFFWPTPNGIKALYKILHLSCSRLGRRAR